MKKNDNNNLGDHNIQIILTGFSVVVLSLELAVAAPAFLFPNTWEFCSRFLFSRFLTKRFLKSKT